MLIQKKGSELASYSQLSLRPGEQEPLLYLSRQTAPHCCPKISNTLSHPGREMPRQKAPPWTPPLLAADTAAQFSNHAHGAQCGTGPWLRSLLSTPYLPPSSFEPPLFPSHLAQLLVPTVCKVLDPLLAASTLAGSVYLHNLVLGLEAWVVMLQLHPPPSLSLLLPSPPPLCLNCPFL